MSDAALPFIHESAPRQSKPFQLVCCGLLTATFAYVAGLWLSHSWIIDADGRPIHSDFTSVYAAGSLALSGNPAAAYDWDLHYAAENAVIAHYKAAYLGWHYPPPFLLIAALLATLPYAAAFVVWIGASLPIYLLTIRSVLGSRIGWLFAGAFPGLLPNIVPGQNGLFTASLIGGTLLLLERYPVMAGCCLGLLTYKPQFGILFPFVLVAGGHWRALAAAVSVALVLLLGTVAAFGAAPWAAFLHWLPLTSQALFSQGHAAFSQTATDWAKFQSVFAFVRLAGGDSGMAWTLQGLAAAGAALALCLVLRSSRIAYDVKAAATALAVVLATPYVYLYDLTIIAVAVSFLLRQMINGDRLAGEASGIAASGLALLLFPFLGMPPGLWCVAIIAPLIGRRMLRNCASAAAD